MRNQTFAQYAARTYGWNLRIAHPSIQPIRSPKTINRLLNGEIMAIKGIGGFHLVIDAANEPAVSRLRERKHRYGKTTRYHGS